MFDKEHIDKLLLLLKKGDEKAFSSIYNYYWDKLYYVAYQKLQDRDAAEEIVQDVFLILWKKREELSIDSLSNYLAAMVRYSVYRYLAREKAMRAREIGYDKQYDKIASLEDELSNKLILNKVLELSNQLPLKCRLVFQHNKLEDRSLQDVAKQLNISQKTAEAHLTKALKLIRFSMRSMMNFFL